MALHPSTSDQVLTFTWQEKKENPPCICEHLLYSVQVICPYLQFEIERATNLLVGTGAEIMVAIGPKIIVW